MSSLSSEVSQNTERSKANAEGVANFKETDTSQLQERIAKLEEKLFALENNSMLINEKVNDTEENLSIWIEKELTKVWDAINSNPLGN